MIDEVSAPSKAQKEDPSKGLVEDIPSLEDIIGQMPKPEMDDITKLQVSMIYGLI